MDLKHNDLANASGVDIKHCKIIHPDGFQAGLTFNSGHGVEAENTIINPDTEYKSVSQQILRHQVKKLVG